MSVCTSMAEEVIRKATGRFRTSVESWGFNNPPKYHADRFYTYTEFPNKRDLDVADNKKQLIQEYDQHTSMFNGSALHVWKAQSSSHLILESESICISRPRTTYVLNDGPIYTQGSLVGVCSRSEGEIRDTEPQKRKWRPNGRDQS